MVDHRHSALYDPHYGYTPRVKKRKIFTVPRICAAIVILNSILFLFSGPFWVMPKDPRSNSLSVLTPPSKAKEVSELMLRTCNVEIGA